MAWPSASARTKTWGTEILTSGDLDGQFDVLHTYNNDQLNATSGHKHSGGTNDGPQIPLTTGVTGVLPLANGGTGQATLAALGNLFYPVGSVYTNTSDSTNPATLLGFGTWTAVQAVALVGYKSGDSNFGTPGATVGEATHVLTVPEIPAHTHTVKSTGGAGTGYATAGFNTLGDVSGSTGGGGSHNNIQPSLVVYMWQRTV